MASAEVSNLTFSRNIIDSNSFCDNKIDLEEEHPSLLIEASAPAEENMFDDLENNDDSRGGGESLEECGSLSDGADQDCSICRFVQSNKNIFSFN